MKKVIQASVRDITDFVYSEGDILPFMVQKNNLRDGTLIHQEVQRSISAENEVFVKYDGEFNGYDINLQGRIDILDKDKDTYHIIEIKSTYSFDGLSEETNLAHFAQAKFYGFILYHYLNLDKKAEIKISVLYINKFTYERKYFTNIYTYEELKTFFYDTLTKYLEFFEIIDQFHELKLKSINNLFFPYKTYRKGQQELIDNVCNAIKEKKNLFVCAPTGIGKSLGTIYPALKSLETKNNKIFYLTSKSMIKEVARSAVNILRSNSDLRIKSLVLTAKEKICLNNCLKCNPKDCIYAKGFYDRCNDAILDIFEHTDDFDYDMITTYAKKYTICPFEYQLMLSLYSDLIIGDYNYVFDIRVYLKRFFDTDPKGLILLIDEAHNMYDRVCNMYTSQISISLFNNILDILSEEKNISQSVNLLVIKLKQYQKHLRDNLLPNCKFNDLDEVIIDEINNLVSKLEKYFLNEHMEEKEINEELLSIYFGLINFLKIAEFFNEDFIIWTENKDNDFIYQITCLNPRDLIKLRTDVVSSSIFFSATLHPMDYYLSLLGGDENSQVLYLDSPFEQSNLQLLINPFISTKFQDRDNTKYQIAYKIRNLISLGGKYMVYFPSYQYLETVYQTFNKINDLDIEIIKQSRDMTEKERKYFLDSFDDSDRSIVGFAVLGGVFAEGIDLKGEKLNGVCIVGVGLPMFNDFRNELRNYFDKVYHKGYQYAYMYPGFNKVLQAVGRVIRDENDKGTALLIDDRYYREEYLRLFPKHWSHYKIIE